MSRSHLRLLSSGILFASVAGVLLTACGPKFATCKERRTCPEGGAAGEGGEGTAGTTVGGMFSVGGGGASGSGGTSVPRGDGGVGASTHNAGGDASIGEGDAGEAGEPSRGGRNGSGRAGSGGGGAAGPGGAAATGGSAGSGRGRGEGGDGAGDEGAVGGASAQTPSCAADAAPPRLIAPLSTALVTNRRPTVELERGDDCGPVTVEFCSTRDCTTILTSIELGADATDARPTEQLPSGVVFWRARSGDRTSATWQFTLGKGAPTDTWWGTIPDFNGDGKADVAVGTTSGTVHVYYGSTQGLSTSNSTTLQAPADAAGYVFGAGLASAGDVNGDGFADLVVGAPKPEEGALGSRIYLYWGSAQGIRTGGAEVIDLPQWPTGWVSTLVMRGGADANQDGYADFVVPWPASETVAYSTYFGSRDGTPTAVQSPRSLATHSTNFGTSLALCDLNNDRRTDMIVGAPGSSVGDQGYVLTLEGSGFGFVVTQELLFTHELASGGYGTGVACADFSASGYPAVLASDPIAGLYYGELVLFENNDGQLASEGISVLNTYLGETTAAGRPLITPGDVDGNGTADYAFGRTRSDTGTANVLFAMRSEAPDIVELRPTQGDVLDFHLSTPHALTGGDIDGDGLGDLAVSSRRADARERITIFRGSRASRVIAPSMTHVDAPQGATDFGRWLSAGL